MKKYLFIYFILSLVITFSCSDKNSPSSKNHDSPNSMAAPTKSKVDQQTLKNQESKSGHILKPSPTLKNSHVSGVNLKKNNGFNTPKISGSQHISGQTNYPSNTSRSKSHISGRTASANISGQ